LAFDDPLFLDKCQYHKTTQKARSAQETREYWQSRDLRSFSTKASWAGLRSVVITSAPKGG